MTGTWQFLRSLFEARSVNDYKEDIFKYMSRRYGEHESDELRLKMKTLPFKEFKRFAAVTFMDDKLESLIDTMAKQAIAVHRARQAPPPEAVPGKTVAPSGKTFADPDEVDDRQSKIDAMRQARHAPRGGEIAAKALMTPAKGDSRHSMRGPSQFPLKQQPSVAAGVQPQHSADDLKKMGVARSGFVRAQREVDKLTKEKGEEAGNKLARELGVPTTAERTTEHPDTGQKKVQIWGPDRIFKHMDQDQNPDAASKTDTDRKAAAYRRSKFSQSGQIDPDRLEKIKQGIIKRNAAPTKLGPDRPGSFHGERWKPHGREEKGAMFRPDKVTGNWVHGSTTKNPKDTGQELFWNKHQNQWQMPSVFAASEAERGASRARDVNPFDDDSKTDPEGQAFPSD